jgi:hypothetical protein
VGKRKMADVYLEVRKRRRSIYFLNETSACGSSPGPVKPKTLKVVFVASPLSAQR